MDYKKRTANLIKKIDANKLDAILVTKPENVFYLTSFFSDSVVLLVSPKRCFAITDFRYAEAAGSAIRDFELIVLNNRLDSFPKAISAVVSRCRAKKIGFEASSVTFSQYRSIKRAIGNKALVSAADPIESLREIKEAGEIDAIKRSFSITKETLKEVKRILDPDMTEMEILRYIKQAFIRKGAFGSAFEPIVATQPGASQPHYRTGAKRLGNNKPILIDLGANYEGYNSDLTRVCILGKIKAQFSRLYTILIDAQKRALDLVRPGAKISDVDNAARQYIARKGFGKFFGHSLGHGIGLEIHEKPTITHRNDNPLREGMVFTVEPGIYIPGYGGLRIEDAVLVTKNGCKVLTYDIDK